jgi:hypothetical protein
MANVSVAVRTSGYIILDVDPRHNGWDNLIDWADDNGVDLTAVPRAVSPRGDGGCHLWWRLPDGATYPHSALLRGVDRPWQVAVPPSMRWVRVDPEARGIDAGWAFRPYLWQAGDPRSAPVAPDCLLGPGASTTQSGGSNGVRTTLGVVDVDNLARSGVPVGEQSYTYKRMACSMIAKGWDDETVVRTILLTADRSPIGDSSRPWTEYDIRAMVGHARRYISGEREKERLTAQQMAWAAGIGRRMNQGR